MLAARHRRDPARGYVEYFLDQLRPHLATLAERGVKVVTNAGGFHPAGLADAVRAAAAEAGVTLSVAHVEGDNILAELGAAPRRTRTRRHVRDRERRHPVGGGGPVRRRRRAPRPEAARGRGCLLRQPKARLPRQGVTDQVRMSATPGHYRTVLVPRGSCRREWS
jgi:hypothetical protein